MSKKDEKDDRYHTVDIWAAFKDDDDPRLVVNQPGNARKSSAFDFFVALMLVAVLLWLIWAGRFMP